MPRRKNEKYEKNPFRQELIEDTDKSKTVKTVVQPVKKNERLSAMLIKTDRQGNALEETPASLALMTPKVVDANEFVKIYTKGVAGMFGLTKAGQKVFYLLFEELSGPEGQGKDVVTLQYSALPEELKKVLKYRTFTNGINDLIKNRFIAESIYTNQYFVNPTYIYNGDRLAIVTLYKKQDKEETEEVKKQEPVKTDKNGTRFVQPNLDLGEPGLAPWEEQE